MVLRLVPSEDAMTTDWPRVPYDVLTRISGLITNEVPDQSGGTRRDKQATCHHRMGVVNTRSDVIAHRDVMLVLMHGEANHGHIR